MELPLDDIIAVTRQAGAIVMSYHERRDYEIIDKSTGEVVGRVGDTNLPRLGNNTVTTADIEANACLVEGMSRILPSIGVVAEEDPLDKQTSGLTKRMRCYIDACDGSRSFVRGDVYEFSVNIGFYDAQTGPVGGAIYFPGLPIESHAGTMYFVGNDGNAYKQIGENEPQKIQVATMPQNGSHLEVIHGPRGDVANIRRIIGGDQELAVTKAVGAYRYALVAEGAAHLCYAPERYRWDTTAGFALINAAGGKALIADHSARNILKHGEHIAASEALLENLAKESQQVKEMLRVARNGELER